MFELRDYTVVKVMQGEDRFFVPMYQRSSSWKSETCKKFADDMLDAEVLDDEAIDKGSEYFIGTFILKLQKKDIGIYEIIDGQQRLIAISLFMAAFYKILIEFEKKYKSRQNTDNRFLVQLGILSKDIKSFLVTEKNELRFKASKYEGNDNNYKQILQECKIHTYKGDKKIFKKSNMTKAFAIYQKSLQGNKNINFNHLSVEDALEGVDKILKRFKKIRFIVVEVQSRVDACQLFDCFNNRGKKLEIVDIVKNMLFDKSRSKNSVEIFFDKWNSINLNLKTSSEKASGKESKLSDRYLLHFYNAFYKEDANLCVSESPVSKPRLPLVYEKIITNKGGMSASTLIYKLEAKSKIYNVIIDPDVNNFLKIADIKNTETANNIVNGLIDLNKIGATSSNILLLYLFSIFSKQTNIFHDKEKALERIVDFLVKFFIRRNISDFPPNNAIDNLMDSTIKDCEKTIHRLSDKVSSQKLEEFVISKSEILERQDFKSNLQHLTANTPSNKTLIKVIFKKINNDKLELFGHKSTYVNVNDQAELEHIMPRNLTPDWIEEIADGDRNEAESLHEKWLHCLGNLTLTNVNQKFSDSSFHYKQKEIADGYSKTNFWLDNFNFKVEEENESYTLANAPRWNKNFISGRNEVLIKHIVSFYQFESERD